MPQYSSSQRISRVETTNDTLTGRGGLALFVRYLSRLELDRIVDEEFGGLRKSAKGLRVWNLFLQVFCWLFDGTSRHLNYFDQLAKDEGYAALLENEVREMASSHAIKRFFKSMVLFKHGMRLRTLLSRLFEWRLCLAQPEVLELSIDTMVMNNDEAQVRHGVQPTYKKVKGFQPLHMLWEGKIVDAVFRGGKKSGNCGNTVINMIQRNVEIIRRACGPDVLIVLRIDSGFFDERILEACDALGIGVILSGKMYESVKSHVATQPPADWDAYDNGHQVWQFMEFGWRCDKWRRFYRTIYTRPVYEDRQALLDFARPDNVILTNLGVTPQVLARVTPEQRKHWLNPETIIESHHGRGADELPHRGFKDFAFEQLPFKRFSPNAALYYCMVIGFFLFETFKEDVLGGVVPEVLPVTSYASTVRRKVVDIAAKIVKTGHEAILKVTNTVMEHLKFDQLWARCQDPPPIPRVA